MRQKPDAQIKFFLFVKLLVEMLLLIDTVYHGDDKTRFRFCAGWLEMLTAASIMIALFGTHGYNSVTEN